MTNDHTLIKKKLTIIYDNTQERCVCQKKNKKRVSRRGHLGSQGQGQCLHVCQRWCHLDVLDPMNLRTIMNSVPCIDEKLQGEDEVVDRLTNRHEITCTNLSIRGKGQTALSKALRGKCSLTVKSFKSYLS